LHNIFT